MDRGNHMWQMAWNLSASDLDHMRLHVASGAFPRTTNKHIFHSELGHEGSPSRANLSLLKLHTHTKRGGYFKFSWETSTALFDPNLKIMLRI